MTAVLSYSVDFLIIAVICFVILVLTRKFRKKKCSSSFSKLTETDGANRGIDHFSK